MLCPQQFWLSFTPLKDMLVEAQRQRAKVTGERPDDVVLSLQLSFNRVRGVAWRQHTEEACHASIYAIG